MIISVSARTEDEYVKTIGFIADKIKALLTDTCLTAQDKYKAYLDYFRIAYLA